jgi:hypothetical protein
MRGVNAQDRRAVKSGGIRPDQLREARVFEGLRYYPDTVCTFWMTRSGIVIEIRKVAQKKGGHGGQTRGALAAGQSA